MSALIDNVLDFVRGRLGGGASLHRTRQELQPVARELWKVVQAMA